MYRARRERGTGGGGKWKGGGGRQSKGSHWEKTWDPPVKLSTKVNSDIYIKGRTSLKILPHTASVYAVHVM